MSETEQVRLVLKKDHTHRGIFHFKGSTIVTSPNRAERMIFSGIAGLATVLDLGSLPKKKPSKKKAKSKSKLVKVKK